MHEGMFNQNVAMNAYSSYFMTFVLFEKQKTASHHKEQDKKNEKSATMMKCPVCAIEVDYEKSFLPLADNKQGSLRKLTIVPLLFRHDPVKDANNNSPVVTRLFNHPSLVKLPSIMNATEFNEFVKSINPFPDHDYKIVNASWDVSL